jgi:1-acyl-sn-glycerol-3-phosphate acyltransferase
LDIGIGTGDAAQAEADRTPNSRPLLLVANHMGWWDGFVLMRVQKKIRPRAPIYTIMLETELRKNPWFWPLGALGIQPGSTASLRALYRRLDRLRGTDAVVAFFPQGRILPFARRPLDFREGALAIARKLAPVTILPVALTAEYGSHPRPTLQARVGAPLEFDPALTTADLERAVRELLDQSAGNAP